MGQTAFFSTCSLLSIPGYIIFKYINNDILRTELFQVVCLAIAGFFTVSWTIPIIQLKVPSILSGKDLCKKGTPAGDTAIPEALGIVSGTVFVVCMILGMTFLADTPNLLIRFSSGLLSICFMMCLGFVDDVMDLPWRYKLILPPIAALPLLTTYSGATAVTLPMPVRFLFAENGLLTPIVQLFVGVSRGGEVVELGVFYMLYMGLMTVFCTNAINIYAGINGLEAGQSFVIGISVLTLNLVQIARDQDGDSCHLFSIMFIVPFLFSTLGLLRHNWYPSTVFVGDTFCYYSGMTFAVVGILGHFSKTLMLFFLPQFLNFIYSLPQLFRIIPCPRHRLPKFNPKTGLMECSMVPGRTYANLTLINLALHIFGPMKEEILCLILLFFQVLCCVIGFFIRFQLASLLYEFTN